MGGKTQTKTQQYTPTGASGMGDIWSRVQQAASTPYEAYGGNLVAGLNPVQQSGIQNINDAAGTAQPYINQAAQYAQQGAANIDPSQVQAYMNPYTNSVIDATQRNFNEGNAQQQQQVIGNAIQQGAWGGDRAGIAQSELARQQNLSQAPVIAGLQSQNYQQALAAAQQDRAAKAAGAYTYGSLGPASQAAAIQGGQAQIGAGSVSQQNEQAQLAADYQQFMQKQAFPYQQAGFMASAGLPALSAQGGTQTMTQPGPSIFGQIAGLGMAGLGAFAGKNPFSGWFGQSFGNGSTGGNGGFARGGRVGYAGGGAVKDDGHDDFMSTIHTIRQTLRGGGAVHGYDSGGVVRPSSGNIWDIYPMGGQVPSMVPERPGSGLLNVNLGDYGPSPNDRVMQGFQDFNELQPVQGSLPIPPQMANVPLPRPRPQMGDEPFQFPPQMAGAAPAQAQPPEAMAFNNQEPPLSAMQQPSQNVSRETSGQGSGPFNLSEDARLGLISAGLGMMASQSPFALSQIGEGGTQGLGVYIDRKKDRARIESEAKRLAQAAEQFGKTHDLSERTRAETERAHKSVEGLQREKFDYDRNKPIEVGGALVTPKGEVIYKGASGLLDDDTIKAMAQQYRAGDTSVLTNLGRGSQGAENIVKLRQEVQKQNTALGLGGADQAVRNAEFQGVKSGQRTLGTKQANIELAATEFKEVIPIVQQASKAVSRTEYPRLNKVIQMWEEGTGDPKIVAFGGGINTLVNLYARAISPQGVGTVSDKEHARELLQKAWSQGQFDAAVGMMQQEIDAALRSPEKVRDDMRKRFLGGQGGPGSAPSHGVAAPASAPSQADRKADTVYMTPKGPMKWTGSGWTSP